MNPEVVRPKFEDERSKNVKSQLGATALEIRNFLLQSDEEISQEVEDAEKYHDLVDRRINHISDPDIPEYFVDWQAECFEKIKKTPNVILSSPTGSGKTSVFLEWAKFKQQEANQENPGHRFI